MKAKSLYGTTCTPFPRRTFIDVSSAEGLSDIKSLAATFLSPPGRMPHGHPGWGVEMRPQFAAGTKIDPGVRRGFKIMYHWIFDNQTILASSQCCPIGDDCRTTGTQYSPDPWLPSITFPA